MSRSKYDKCGEFRTIQSSFIQSRFKQIEAFLELHLKKEKRKKKNNACV